MKYSSSIYGARIHLAASRGTTRYSIMGVQVEPTGGGRGMAVATDGRILAAAPIDYDEGEPQEKCVVPVGAFTAWEKCKAPILHLNGKAMVRTTAWEQSFALLDVRFPSWRDFIPTERDQEGAVTFWIDADKLKQLADALTPKKGQRIVGLTVCRDEEGDYGRMPILVRPMGKADGRIGVIMPCAED